MHGFRAQVRAFRQSCTFECCDMDEYRREMAEKLFARDHGRMNDTRGNLL